MTLRALRSSLAERRSASRNIARTKLVRRWRRLPPIDAEAFRADLDEWIDPRL